MKSCVTSRSPVLLHMCCYCRHQNHYEASSRRHLNILNCHCNAERHESFRSQDLLQWICLNLTYTHLNCIRITRKLPDYAKEGCTEERLAKEYTKCKAKRKVQESTEYQWDYRLLHIEDKRSSIEIIRDSTAEAIRFAYSWEDILDVTILPVEIGSRLHMWCPGQCLLKS